jgi:hypothetical protein
MTSLDVCEGLTRSQSVTAWERVGHIVDRTPAADVLSHFAADVIHPRKPRV